MTIACKRRVLLLISSLLPFQTFINYSKAPNLLICWVKSIELLV